MNGARGVIINVTGGPDLSLVEVSEASSIVQEAADEDANIIFGAVVDPTLKGKVKITVIATGFGPHLGARPVGSVARTPVDLTQYADGARLRGEAAIVPASRGRGAAALASPVAWAAACGRDTGADGCWSALAGSRRRARRPLDQNAGRGRQSGVRCSGLPAPPGGLTVATRGRLTRSAGSGRTGAFDGRGGRVDRSTARENAVV